MLSIEITGPIWQKFRTNSVQDTSFILQTEGLTPTIVKVGFVVDKEEVVCVCVCVWKASPAGLVQHRSPLHADRCSRIPAECGSRVN